MRRPWVSRLVLALALALAVGWLPFQFFGRSGLSRLIKLRAEVKAVHLANASLRTRNASLRAELALYDDDALGAVERIARDELGLVKPGEIVFKVEDDARQARALPLTSGSPRRAPADPPPFPAARP